MYFCDLHKKIKHSITDERVLFVRAFNTLDVIKRLSQVHVLNV